MRRAILILLVLCLTSCGTSIHFWKHLIIENHYFIAYDTYIGGINMTGIIHDPDCTNPIHGGKK